MNRWRHRISACHRPSWPVEALRLHASPRSGCAWLRGLFLSRFGADWLSRLCRPDAERSAGHNRGDRGLGFGPELRPAARTELRFVPNHAGRDAVDIRNEVAAQAKRVAAAGLLLFGGVGPAC